MLEVFHEQEAGARDQDIDLAKALHGLGDHLLNGRDAACVAFDGKGAVAANLLDDGVGAAGTRAVIKGGISAVLGKQEGGCCPAAFGVPYNQGSETSE